MVFLMGCGRLRKFSQRWEKEVDSVLNRGFLKFQPEKKVRSGGTGSQRTSPGINIGGSLLCSAFFLIGEGTILRPYGIVRKEGSLFLTKFKKRLPRKEGITRSRSPTKLEPRIRRNVVDWGISGGREGIPRT